MSFNTMRSVTLPESLNTVGHGAVAEHGAGDVTMVSTSELRNPLAVPVDVPPRDAVSLSITSRTGALPSRTTSPHDTHADTTAAMQSC